MKEYFWEYEYPFATFLKGIFPKTFKRKYGIKDSGIYNLILVNDKIYDVTFKQAKTMLEDNGTLTTEKLKNKIIQNILDNLKENAVYTVNNGKITLKVDNYIAKIEVIKKTRMPE